LKINKPINYAPLRAAAYDPIYEQVERLTAALAYLQDSGVDIGPDGRAQIAHRQEVKANNPKEGKRYD